uniref:Uncharacterized protein n=1 Tax=Anopheles albimanus TaxID=7167 RepID=A0A182FZD2_ANOAL
MRIIDLEMFKHAGYDHLEKKRLV